MAKGISIHIGLNSVDPTQYGGWSGELLACEFDANDMAAIADSRGFTTTTILTAQATSDAVLGELAAAAKKLKSGDTLLLTYSGHGGQLPDADGDEPDGADETWVLHDRQVIDDELYAAYGQFAKGVRIAVFSDSCHSGTVTRVGPPAPAGIGGPVPPAPQLPPGTRARLMPPELAQKDFLRRRDSYTAIEAKNADVDPHEIAPCVVLISGCQDEQLSLDGTFNGLFTGTLLTVWNGGAFSGSYRTLHRRIAARMPDTQSPKLTVVGTYDRQFVMGRALAT